MKLLVPVCCAVIAAVSAPVLAQDIQTSKRSAVVLQLEHIPPDSANGKSRAFRLKVEGNITYSKDAPNGSVFPIKAREGSSFRYLVTGLNRFKYSLKEDEEAIPEPALQMPKIFADALKGLLPELKKPENQANNLKVNNIDKTADFNTDLEGFDIEAQKVEKIIDFLDAADKAVKSAESKAELTAALNQAGAVIKPNGGWDTLTDMPLQIAQYKASVKSMRASLNRMEAMAADAGNPLPLKYVLLAANRIYKDAEEGTKPMETAANMLINYVKDPDATIFTMPGGKTFKYTNGRLILTLSLFDAKDEKKERPMYRVDFDITSENKEFADWTSGVFLSSVTDETYNLGTGNIIQKRGTSDDLKVHLGAMRHWGYMLNKDVGIAASLGLALSEERYQVFVGASLALGRSRSFYLTGGAAIGTAKRLKGYNIGDTFTGTAADIPTDTFTKVGWFVGLSYKF